MAEWLNAGDVNNFLTAIIVPLIVSYGVIDSYFNSMVNLPTIAVYVGPNPTLSTNGGIV